MTERKAFYILHYEYWYDLVLIVESCYCLKRNEFPQAITHILL